MNFKKAAVQVPLLLIFVFFFNHLLCCIFSLQGHFHRFGNVG